jgi:hypothetical protein
LGDVKCFLLVLGTPTFFYGGSIHGVSWCPMPAVVDGSTTERDQYLAVSVLHEEHLYRSASEAAFGSEYLIQSSTDSITEGVIYEKDSPETKVSNHPTTSNSGIYESSTDSITEGVIYEKDSPETQVSNHPTTSTGVCATSSLSSTEGVTYEAKKSKINTSLNIKDKKEDINESVNEIKSKMRDILQATVYTGSGRKAILKCNLARAMFYLLSETKTETKGSR